MEDVVLDQSQDVERATQLVFSGGLDQPGSACKGGNADLLGEAIDGATGE